MSIFSGVASKIVAAAKAFKADLVKAANATPGILAKIEADAPEVEALTSLVFPAAATVEATGLKILEAVAGAVEATGSAAGASGLSVPLDQALIQEVKALLPQLKAFLTTGK
jgi:hypothetical protein